MRTVGRRPQGDKAPLPTAIPKPPDLPRRGSAADGRKQDDMQDDSRRQPEGRDGQDHPVRFGDVSLVVFGEGKAFLRHHINALSDAIPDIAPLGVA